MRLSLTANVVLWFVQGFLALFFAAASGAPKLLMPYDALPMPIALPELFVRLIGVCEVLGALGLVLPGISGVRPGLTRVAATCLVLLTLCAATYQLLAQQPANAVFALVMGALCASVAYGRTRVPTRAARPRTAFASASV